MRSRTPSRQSIAVLQALRERSTDWSYGYDLARVLRLSSGTLYPILIRLHERGLLEARWMEPERSGRPARHAYRLTPNGLAFARELGRESPSTVRPGDEVLA